jgi:hypothetical protein
MNKSIDENLPVDLAPGKGNPSRAPAETHCDWLAIEEEMGDNPFKNAPPILPHQYFKQ